MIYYFLVLIAVSTEGVTNAKALDTFRSMDKCFDARDMILVELKKSDGYFDLGLQAVCIPQKTL